MNDHEVHEECMRLLRDGLPVPAPAAFEEGRDFLPLGLDMDGDVAVVTFLHQWGRRVRVHRGLDVPSPRRRVARAGRCRRVGPAEPLARRSSGEMGRHLLKYGSGRTVRNSNRLLPWGAKWVNEARLRASAEVVRVRVGKRILDVPEHGHVVVVWGARRGPVVEALAADGSVLDALDLDRPFVAAHPKADI